MRVFGKFSLLLAGMLVAGIAFVITAWYTGYLTQWWNGRLPDEVLGFGTAKVNKVMKLAQFTAGLLTVFELVRVAKFWNDLDESKIAYVLIWIARLPLWVPPYIIASVLLFIAERTPGLASTKAFTLVQNDFANELAPEKRNKSPRIFKILAELSDAWLCERALKRLTYVCFVVFTMGDIMTG